MGRICSFLFNEDLDLNAAAAQLAAANGQVSGITLKDADTIQLPNAEGMYLLGVRVMDETVGGGGMGYLHFPGHFGDRKLRFGENLHIGDNFIREIKFIPGTFYLPPKQRIKAFGNDSGSGAEQHVIIGDFWHPGLPPIPTIQPNQMCKKGVMMTAMKTGTLIAATISGLSSVLGDVTAFEDSEIELPTTKDQLYALLKLGNYPGGAGYGVCGVRSPDGLSDRLFPAVIAMNVMGRDYDLGWLFTGDAPPKLVGCGVGTTSTQFQLTIGQLK